MDSLIKRLQEAESGSREVDLYALHAAVTVARNEQIRTLSALQSRLGSMGFSNDEIVSAIKVWAQYYARGKSSETTP